MNTPFKVNQKAAILRATQEEEAAEEAAINHRIQAQLVGMVFGPGTGPSDILRSAEDANLTPQAYIGECLRVAIENQSARFFVPRALLEDENAQHTICDFAGVVDG